MTNHQQFLRQHQRKKNIIFAVQICILFACLGNWELAANYEIIDPFITSQPSSIAKTLLKLIEDGTLFTHIGITVGETIIGFLIGTILGTICASCLWWSEFASKVLDPYIVVLNALPKIALGPIFIIWLGNGLPAIIAMALAISFITTMMVVLNGFTEVNENQVKLLKTFGATKQQILFKVIIPASIPTIISATKINIGLTLVGVIVGEFLVSKAGLGYLIIYGGQVFNLNLVITSIIILSIVAALMYKAVTFLEQLYFSKRN